MQRPTTSSRAPEEHQIIIMQQQTPSRKTDETDYLPTFNPLSEIGRRESRRSRSSHYSRHWIHCIPVIIFLCFFILWWFSYPVTVEIKDGRVFTFHRIEGPPSLNDSARIDLAILRAATSPYSSVPQNSTMKNGGEPPYEG